MHYKQNFNESKLKNFLKKDIGILGEELFKYNDYDCMFYSYDEYNSGITTKFKGIFSLKRGIIIIKQGSNFISLQMKQVLSCESSFDGGSIIYDFKLVSGGSATLIFN